MVFLESWLHPSDATFSLDNGHQDVLIHHLFLIFQILSQSILRGLSDNTMNVDPSNGAGSQNSDSSASQDRSQGIQSVCLHDIWCEYTICNWWLGGTSGSRRRRQQGMYSLPIRSIRRRTSNERQLAPLENIIQEFIINLSGFEWDAVGLQGQGSPLWVAISFKIHQSNDPLKSITGSCMEILEIMLLVVPG